MLGTCKDNIAWGFELRVTLWGMWAKPRVTHGTILYQPNLDVLLEEFLTSVESAKIPGYMNYTSIYMGQF